jgi:hypothetical protein
MLQLIALGTAVMTTIVGVASIVNAVRISKEEHSEHAKPNATEISAQHATTA